MYCIVGRGNVAGLLYHASGAVAGQFKVFKFVWREFMKELCTLLHCSASALIVHVEEVHTFILNIIIMYVYLFQKLIFSLNRVTFIDSLTS